MDFRTQIISWNDTLYKVKRTISEQREFDVHEYAKYIHADKVAKKNGFYFFLEEITEPNEVEYIKNERNEITINPNRGQDSD